MMSKIIFLSVKPPSQPSLRGEGVEYQSFPILESGRGAYILLFTRGQITPYISGLTKRAVYNIFILRNKPEYIKERFC